MLYSDQYTTTLGSTLENRSILRSKGNSESNVKALERNRIIMKFAKKEDLR